MKDIDAYIERFPAEVQFILEKIRTIVREIAPNADEAISYAMPTFKLNGNLIHFAAYKNHIGLYPTPAGIDEFSGELSHYKGAKGSVQFSLNQPIPYDLIARIVAYRVAKNLEKGTVENRKK